METICCGEQLDPRLVTKNNPEERKVAVVESGLSQKRRTVSALSSIQPVLDDEARARCEDSEIPKIGLEEVRCK
jgi:hypothetical protein